MSAKAACNIVGELKHSRVHTMNNTIPKLNSETEVAAKFLSAVSEIYFTEKQTADRYLISVKSLQAHRWKGTGLPYVKIGRLVRYRLSDLLESEKANTFGGSVR